MAARSQFNSKSPTIKRILREAAELSSSPSADYTATPQEDNLFEWHFTLRGPPGNSTTPDAPTDGPYAEGIYHGRIVLPATYPLRPPSFRFLTPSGRFETNREICLSISGHHEETWQPAWGLRTALVALRTFMETDPGGQVGGLECSESQRKRLAKQSQTWKCSSCGKSNGDILKECEEASKLLETKEEVEIPKELKMCFKDEMGKVAAEGSAGQDNNDNNNSEEESAELAEGFVQTAPIPPTLPPATSQAPTPPTPRAAPYPRAAPVQGVPRPTATIAGAQRPHVPLAMHARPVSSDGVPAWVDKAIVGVVACLIAMLLRLIFK